MDPNFGLPLQFPSAFTTVHAPIPVDQRTHEGRYVWEPRLHSLSHASNRGCVEGGGANLPDFSHFVPRRDLPNGHHHMEIPPHYRLSPYMEQVISSLHGNPTLAAPMMADARVPMSMDYLQQMSMLHQRNLLDVHGGLPPMATSVADLGLGLDGSQIGSPKPGVRHGRKRALSSSPYSDFDINSMIRFSPNSLVSFMNGSRSSSASGSYGHLSAGSLSPAMGVSPPAVLPHFHQLHHLMRQGLTSPFLLPPTGGLGQQSLFPGHLHGVGTASKDPLLAGIGEHGVQGFGAKSSKNSQAKSIIADSVADDKDAAGDLKDEPGDFVETNCHWTDCDREFPTQEDLVKHICQDHIHSNKKAFVCRWKDCSREEKPFKAQYMLVVHMRRHTGEKPHRCTFEGCLKAYSRLENLKTHLRSHTGEKPYLCEFPGCTKAFSNASDRAKHQNRTHSNEKPYVCKAQGCTKRYTDPSSLRKHVKTVHGPDFYAKKKHKGDKDDSPGDTKSENQTHDKTDSEGFNLYNVDGQAASLLNPSIQSQDHDHSHQGSANSNEANLCPDPVEQLGVDVPISDNCVSTTSALGEVFETECVWDVEDKVDLENDDPLAAVMCAVTSTGNGNCGVGGGGFLRGRKGGLQVTAKTKGSWFPKFPSAKGLFQRNSCSQVITSSQNTYSAPTQDVETKKTYINLSTPQTNHGCFTTPQTKLNNQLARRRQNSASSVSTYYGSMSSDASSKTQLTNGHNSSITSVTHSTQQSSCDPLSLWGSRRSSDISSLSGISPGHASHLKSLHSEAISAVSDQKGLLHTDKMACTPEHLCCLEKSEKSSVVSTSVPSSVNYSQSNHQQQRILKSPLLGDICPGNYQPCRPNSHNLSSSVTSIKQQNSCPGSCSNQGTEWVQQIDQEAGIEKCAAELSLDDNRELILPDEMVTYLNQVAEQETIKGKSPDKCFSQPDVGIQSIPQIQNCVGCKQDPNERQLYQNSCCKLNKVVSQVPSIQNSNSHLNNNNNPNHNNSNYTETTNSSFPQLPPSYQSIEGNRFKVESLPQSCSQMASQQTSSTNSCPQQMWNSHNSQSAQNSYGVVQTQVCVTHNLSPNLYCNQQHYQGPPSYDRAQNLYQTNNLPVQQQNFRHGNHCSYGNSMDSRNINTPPVYCNHPCNQQLNQNCHQFQYTTGSSIPCSGSNDSNHRYSPKYIANQHAIPTHSQSNSPRQYNTQPQIKTYDQHPASITTQSNSKLYQYHQCTNCSTNGYTQPQCQSRNILSRSGNWCQSLQCSEYPQQNPQCQTSGLLTPPVSSPMKARSSVENSVPVCNQTKSTISALVQNQATLTTNNCLVHHDFSKERSSHSRCRTPQSVVQTDNVIPISHNNGTHVPQPATQSPALSTSNMVINDMNSILSSLMEETKCLRLLQ